MKTKPVLFFFPLIFNLLVNAYYGYPQKPPFEPYASINEINDTCIKDFTAKYVEETVYFMIKISGLEKTSVYTIERSLDGKSFENIGSFIYQGTSAKITIMKCFQDSTPYMFNAYYRVVRYGERGNTYASETLGVFPPVKEETQPLQALTELR